MGNKVTIDKDAFLTGQFWFDAHEQSKDREYSIHFERLAAVKEIIFDTMSPAGTIAWEYLTEILRTPARRVKGAKRFNDFLFAPAPAIKI